MEQKHFFGFAPGGFHSVAYTEWGDPADPRPVVCVHGLTRNGRDFDALAEALAGTGRRVVCPDIVGRGRSQWVGEASAYGYPQYCADMAALIARLDVEAVDWVGTSMGGLIGMFLAGARHSPIRRLVLNDVGPFVPKAFMTRLRSYVGQPVRFATLGELESYLRRVYAAFGALTDSQWRHLAEYSAQLLPTGDYVLAYDPRIADAIKASPEPEDVDLWAYWQLVQVPVLVVRGAESDLLSAETVARMRESHPHRQVDESVVQDAGHAPALMAADQIAAIADWLAGHRAAVTS
ncbi:MAG: alpha/beta hydrolase [Alphaproteobacteria bacterium]